MSSPDEKTSGALEAENAVIGSILIDAACLEVIQPRLVPEDMAMEANKAILKAAYALSAKGEKIDPVTITDYLKRRGIEISGEYIFELYEITPTAANAAAYADIVKQNSIKRQIKEIGRQIVEAEEIDPYTAITDIQEKLEVIAGSRQAPIVDGVEMGMEFLNYRTTLTDAGVYPYVQTGFSQLDYLLGGGMLNEGLYILGARPAMGKTTFALAMADNIAKTGKPVLFISLEMSVEQLMSKRIARETRIPSRNVLTESLPPKEYEEVVNATALLSERPLYMNRLNGITVPQIGVMASSIKGLKCIIIDYLGLIRPSRQRTSRYEEMTEISGALKALARRLKIPIVCLAQLNRASEARRDKTPIMADLRDTGAIEQDGDGIMFLYRPDYYENDREKNKSPSVELDVILAKNRHGGTGVVKMALYPANSIITAARM